MLDIKFIRENADRVQKDAIDKGYKNVNVKNSYHKKTNEGTYHKDASVCHVDDI